MAYVDGIAGIGFLEGSWNKNLGTRSAVAAACHGDLSTGDIELGNARRPGVVDA